MKNPYANIHLTIWLQSAAIFISRSGSMVLVFLPLYLIQKLHFSTLAAGQIVSLYGLGEMIGSYYGGLLVDKIGFFRIQFFSLLLTGILFICLEFFTNPIFIMFIICCVGICSAAIRPATGTAIATYCSKENRATAFSLTYQAINLGGAIGPALGGILAGISYMWLFRLDGFANILAAIAMWIFFHNRPFTPHADDLESESTQSPQSLWKNKKFLLFLIFAFLIGMCFFQILSIYPIYLRFNYHLTAQQIGIVMAANCVLIILLQMHISTYFRDFNLLKIIAVGGLLMGIGYV